MLGNFLPLVYGGKEISNTQHTDMASEYFRESHIIFPKNLALKCFNIDWRIL